MPDIFNNTPGFCVKSTEIIPSGMKRGSNAFIVDKMALAFCDGDDNWYVEADKPVQAGQPWSALFTE